MDSFLFVRKINKVEENAFILFNISEEEDVFSDDRPLQGKPIFQGAIGQCLILGKVK